ncbi:MAG: VOC family protein [Candidatus Porifericomitaceae bacterium WSBS_2022_MAG_OTU9]
MKGVYWFEIYVNDLAAAKKFYSKVFDCGFTDIKNEHSSLSVFDWGESVNASCAGALVHYHSRQASSEGIIIYFNVDSLLYCLDRIADSGGKIIRQPMHISNEEMIALASDIEGNPIGLYSNKEY